MMMLQSVKGNLYAIAKKKYRSAGTREMRLLKRKGGWDLAKCGRDIAGAFIFRSDLDQSDFVIGR